MVHITREMLDKYGRVRVRETVGDKEHRLMWPIDAKQAVAQGTAVLDPEQGAVEPAEGEPAIPLEALSIETVRELAMMYGITGAQSMSRRDAIHALSEQGIQITAETLAAMEESDDTEPVDPDEGDED